MKKVIFSLAILASVALVACNKADNKDSETAAPATTEETVEVKEDAAVVESNTAAPVEAESNTAAPAEVAA